jgi:fucose 4-O-acetylase-like acetyltransferase
MARAEHPEYGQGEAWMLNLRYVLIVSVVVAAGIEPLISRFDGLETVSLWIYTFHMPLFAFVTGYFARHNLQGKAGAKVLLGIALQYLLFQSLYSVLDATLFHAADEGRSFFMPYLMLWFLIAHLGWRLLMKLMEALRVPHPLWVSLAIGIAAGYWGADGDWLSLSRMFVFFPFFAVGHRFRPEWLMALYASKLRFLLRLLPAALLAAIPLVPWHDAVGWLYGRFTYTELNAWGWEAPLTRAGVYALQFAAGAGILALIPQRNVAWTKLGTRTLYVFLLHGLFIRTFVYAELYDSIRGWSQVVLLLLGLLALAWLLAQPAVKRLTGWFVEPPVDAWLQRRGLRGGRADRVAYSPMRK